MELPRCVLVMVTDFSQNQDLLEQSMNAECWQTRTGCAVCPGLLFERDDITVQGRKRAIIVKESTIYVSTQFKHTPQFALRILRLQIDMHAKPRLNADMPQITVIDCSDRAPQQYSNVSYLYGLAKLATSETDIMHVFFGECHGKGEWDKEGGIFKQEYINKCLSALGTDSMNLSKIVRYMNDSISEPKTKRDARFVRRRVVNITERSIPPYAKSPVHPLENTRKHYCYLATGDKCFIYVRRYLCFSCRPCISGKFLDCVHKSAGVWNKVFQEDMTSQYV